MRKQASLWRLGFSKGREPLGTATGGRCFRKTIQGQKQIQKKSVCLGGLVGEKQRRLAGAMVYEENSGR